MNIIYATYNINHNSIDIYTYAGYFLRIDCNKAEEGLKTTPCSECALNALAIDNPLDYARLYLEGGMQIWVGELLAFYSSIHYLRRDNILFILLSKNLPANMIL